MKNAECEDFMTDFPARQSRNQSEHEDGQQRIGKAGEKSGE
jgi:hypothetical protein